MRRGIKLEEFFDFISESKLAELRLIIKADVKGSLEVLRKTVALQWNLGTSHSGSEPPNHCHVAATGYSPRVPGMAYAGCFR